MWAFGRQVLYSFILFGAFWGGRDFVKITLKTEKRSSDGDRSDFGKCDPNPFNSSFPISFSLY